MVVVLLGVEFRVKGTCAVCVREVPACLLHAAADDRATLTSLIHRYLTVARPQSVALSQS